MSTAIFFVISIGVLVLFALVGVIIINRSTIIYRSPKQQENEKSTTPPSGTSADTTDGIN